MAAREIFNLVAAEFVGANNPSSLVDGQISAVDSQARHAVKIRAVFDHRERLGVEDVHAAKLVGDDGEELTHPVAQEKFFRPTNSRAIVDIAEKTAEDAIRRDHQLLPPVDDTFDGQWRFAGEGFDLRQVEFGRERHAFDAEGRQKFYRRAVEDVERHHSHSVVSMDKIYQNLIIIDFQQIQFRLLNIKTE